MSGYKELPALTPSPFDVWLVQALAIAKKTISTDGALTDKAVGNPYKKLEKIKRLYGDPYKKVTLCTSTSRNAGPIT